MHGLHRHTTIKLNKLYIIQEFHATADYLAHASVEALLKLNLNQRLEQCAIAAATDRRQHLLRWGRAHGANRQAKGSHWHWWAGSRRGKRATESWGRGGEGGLLIDK